MTQSHSDHVNVKWYKQSIATFVLCLVIGWILTDFDFLSSFNQEWIDRDIRENGIQGVIYFLVIGAVLTACGFPRQLVAFLGGYAFGFVWGTLIATLAAVIGCSLVFYISKYAISPLIVKRFARQTAAIAGFLAAQPTRKTIIIRLLPIGSNLITNLLAGASRINARAFFIGSAVGYLPQMIVFALLGKGILIGSDWKIAVSIVMLAISSVLSIHLYKRYKRSAVEFSSSDNNALKPSAKEEL
ncbi:MAG: VTT domain-containing protein [Paraglaciecola sp.]|nr:VTT domain-containing protein [Paraglaciecola sp.]